MIKLKTKRQPREIMLGFIALGCVVFFFYTKFYKTKAALVVSSAGKITDLKKEISGNGAMLSELKAKVGALEETSKDTSKDDKPTRFLSELISEINARDSGIRVSQYSSHVIKVENSVLSLDLDLELESTFMDLATLIERLEEKYKFLEIKKLEITKVDDFLQKCKSSVSLSVYLDKERI